MVTALADDHPPSLLSLALTSKTYFTWCLPAVKSLFYHDIRLSLDAREGFEKVTKALIDKIQRTEDFRHIRRLIIVDIDEDGVSHEEWCPPKVSDLKCIHAYNGPHERYDSQYAYLSPPVSYQGYPQYSVPRGSEPSPTETLWTPVVNLIKKLPALTDIIYRCASKFPLVLLEALHSELPRCRIHMHSFWLVEDHPAIDPRAFELASLPCLHSIAVRWPVTTVTKPTDNHSSVNVEEDAFLRVLGLAPNLKEVYAHCPMPAPDQPAAISPRKKENKECVPLGSLKTLRIMAHGPICGTILGEWSQYTDFSVLQALELDSNVDHGFFKYWSGLELSFPSLKTLRLDIDTDHAGRRTAEFYQTVSRVLQSLPPLSELQLIGWHSLVSVESITKTHGACLRKLCLVSTLWQCLTEREILHLGEYCPLLEDLAGYIRRTQGDEREVALYRALGTIRRLKHLHLGLEVSPMDLCRQEDILALPGQLSDFEPSEPPIDPSFDEFDYEYTERNLMTTYRARNGHIKKMIINSTVDENLIRAMFQVISSAKPPDSLLLETLILEVTGTSGNDKKLWRLIDLFASDWHIERNITHGRRQELTATERGGCSLAYNEEIREENLDPWLERIFRRIWPAMNEQQPGLWWRTRHSFPLAIDP
ncbi:uncharacterized protein N7459_004868 [Penicillium hispanicum]|uniref:uncharacterized protein n=1 Tax=Penicillium hispanicum TaxID=1080232 RepID=UPI0025419A7F|nr:uncharacterized protein N7459_004868 [Penicillium hispanicum]KAJ5585068.1 hypothetical protein N7459_004868 [Penicillium hispanicum]